jgi:hypothetical protein
MSSVVTPSPAMRLARLRARVAPLAATVPSWTHGA